MGIDDFSRELYAAILSDKSQPSAATFLEHVLEECPYTIDCAYSDNGTAERVLKTLLEMWHAKTVFPPRQDRSRGLARFVNFYNTDKPQAELTT
ncbi:MAG: hypothetical protein NPIRA04_15490 [Nitrospirales bacterium]|nr:MAG: hypothetical protein NPIRA04_15490 [Nitrospirales bacterium]